MRTHFSLDQLLSRFGGWYIIIVIALAQSVALLGAIPGIVSIGVNAEFDDEQLRIFSRLIPLLVLLSYLILLGAAWWITPNARKRLTERSGGSLLPNPGEEFAAWHEITSLTWRYGIAAVLLAFAIVIIPPTILSYTQDPAVTSSFGSAAVNSPVPGYILFGGIVSILGYVILDVLFIDRFTLPARLALVPTDFETQLKGRAGILLIGKFQVLILALIAVGVLLIGPIGYQQTFRSAYSEISSFVVFRDLQIQSVFFTVLVLTLGAGFSYFVSRSVSDPIHELIQTFNRIEQGDLSQRVPISATDELGIVTMQFNRMVTRLETLQSTLEQQVAERTKQLTATNEVGKAASSSLDPSQLLARVINLFTSQFGYYFAAIYLLDPSEKWAELKEGTGEVGTLLKLNHHRLEVSGRNMVGAAIRERSARIAQVASEEKQRFDNPLLPYARSEIALPLIVGERVLGALDIQSTRESDFRPEVIETMKNMAGQVAIALDNARLYQDAQQNLRELRTIQQQYLLEGWSGFSAQSEELEYGVGDESEGTSRRIEIPISLRDQILGQITLERSTEWTPEQESLVHAVAAQAGVALENARLVMESRQIALRERMMAEINSKIWSSATIDGVLQTAVKELGRRLDASTATVELSLDENP